ncbi:MAG: hypothetical protein U0234_07870 [Sandaracinus sp.]
MQTDRRSERSSTRSIALDLQLAACRRDGELEAIVVGNADGLVVGAAGDLEVCTALAARGANLRASAHRFALDGESFAVIALGGTAAARQRELARAAAGATRILRA